MDWMTPEIKEMLKNAPITTVERGLTPELRENFVFIMRLLVSQEK